MRQEVFVLKIPGTGTVSVTVEWKKIASCRLKVFPSQKIKLSVPSEISSEWINQYLHSKKDWIAEKLDYFSKTTGYDATGIIRHGTSIRMLGQDMLFSIYLSEKKLIYTEYRTIHIGLSDLSSAQESKHLFESWWKKQALSVYSEIFDTLFPIIEKHDFKKPKVLIRKMKTLWGSSSPHNGTITLNFYLLKARKPCIEYVILHELIHFLCPYHDRQFYDFLTLYMPDWKDRKMNLDTEVVQGL